MAKKLYTDSISEFIDWISGQDSFTNTEAINTGETPISGKSIRNLIQSHLRKPFYVFEDKENKKGARKLLFSSETSYHKWLNALAQNNNDEETLPKNVKDLVLLEFDMPAAHKLYIKKDSTGAPLSTINILEGSNDKGVLSFVYYLDDDSASTKISCEVKVTVYDTETNAILYSPPAKIYEESYCDGRTPIQFYLGDYLKSGSNKVAIDITSADSTVNAQPIHTSIQMNKISFNISLEFDGNKSFNNPFTYGENISFKVISTKSIMDSVTETINVYVDDFSTIATNGPVITSAWNTLYSAKTISLTNNYALADFDNPNVKHKVLVQAHIESLDNSINFYSNRIYFEFENASEEEDGIENNYINIFTSIPAGTEQTDEHGNTCIVAYQYNKFDLRWGYYTDSKGTNTNPDITWLLRVPDTSVAGQDYKDIVLSALAGDNGRESETLSFIPDTAYDVASNAKLVATVVKDGIDTIIFENPIVIIPSIYELPFDEFKGYVLKLNAYGRSNSESTDSKSNWSFNEYSTTFSENFPWDLNNGWNNNSLALSGVGNTATINFNPFPTNISTDQSIPNKGLSIEIDFMPTNTANESNVLATIGNPNTGACIKIYPSKTSLFIGTSEVLTTNYKSNERIQLMFIFTPTANTDDVGAGNIYIVNNGILERGVGGISYTSLPNANGKIVLGGTNSGIRVYNMRVWRTQMSIYEAFLNYLYDCENKGPIIARNTMIADSGQSISYPECQSKIDTFLITGNLDNILNAGASKQDSESAVNIEYTSISDPNILGWSAEKVKIRKHGQSTLNYPLTSFKIWLNQTKGENTNIYPKVTFKEQFKAKELVKNRYTLRKGDIPANKFVLQANYADSSGVHNGGLLRLINDTWYNAVIDGEYKLRTTPQLFTSGQVVNHNNAQLGETGNSAWVEGYGNTDKTFGGLNASEHTWPELAQALKGLDQLPEFPYQIRNAPDSKPCVVFYQKSVNQPKTYLGQFVFMDDKKSDHIYGERSIYLWDDINDPFCMTNRGANTVINGKKGYDRGANCAWENDNVLRIECVLVNSSLTSFMDFNVSESIELDEDGNPIGDTSGAKPATDIKKAHDPNTGTYVPRNYYWEDYFEMIYPDDSDVAEDDAEKGLTKFDGRYKEPGESDFAEGTSKFIKKTQPWIDFLRWICSIGQLNKKQNGEHYIDGTVTDAALNKFIAEAHDHLDLYKVAAYYVFYIRFGLVDSVERNAQYKTYDGEHWFLEPWDMDIALGNKNTGGLVYDPPLTRDTRMPGNNEIWAFSGRSKTTSNIMWDCLEKWPYWINVIVPKVADALYTAGLSYDNVINMFDEEYANKWSEVLYNYSGMYKYVTAAHEPGWLAWLQGSRTSHRHWWVSTSMNYYDSKWTCGEFNQSRIYLAVNKAQGEEMSIKLWPTSDTFFKLTQKDTTTNLGLLPASTSVPATYNLTNYAFSAKDPTHIFGVLFLEKLDLGKFAAGIEKMIFQNAVDNVLGATIKELNIGSDIPTTNTFTTGWVNGGDFSIANTASISDLDNDDSKLDALENIETINITGQLKITDANIITSTRSKLKNIYAAGSGFTSLTASKQGNKYINLQLPAHNNAVQQDNTVVTTDGVTTFDLKNSSWENLSFWDCTYNANSGWVDGEPYTKIDPETGEEIEVIDKIYVEQNVTYNKLDRIPENFTGVSFTGSTATNPCSARFILDWFDSIEYYVRQAHPELTTAGHEDELEEEVLKVIRNKTAKIQNIRWNYNVQMSSPNYVTFTYKDMIRLGNLNGGIDPENGKSNNEGGTNFTGYIKISGEQMESWQLAELIKYFGENVFTIGNINNNLVIDQDLEYARISVSGKEGVELIGNEIYINEGTPIKFRCTSFLLGTENAKAYDWSVSPNSCRTTWVGDGAYFQVTMNETSNDNIYDVIISADHKTTHASTSLTIHVRPVVVCKNWKFKWVESENATPRKYSMDEAFARNMFGEQHIYNQINGVNTLCDTYVLYQSGMTQELYLNNEIPFTAKLKGFKFRFVNIASTQTNTNEFTISQLANGLNFGWDGNEISSLEEYAQINDGNDIIIDSNEWPIIKARKTATHYISQGTGTKAVKHSNGIVLTTTNGDGISSTFITRTQNMQIFKITVTVQYESESISDQSYSCIIILYDDASPIIRAAQGSGQCLISKLQNDYPGNGYESAHALYKTDLVSLKGTVSFASVIGQGLTDVGRLESLTTVPKSLFDYMPNVEHIDLSNTTYPFTTLDSYFDFTKLKSLRTLKLSNAANAVTTVTTDGHNRIEEIWLDGTNINLHAVNNNSLSLIKLGDPTTVYIDLGTTNSVFDVTNFTCDGSTHLQSLTIINNSTSNTYAYKLFDKIYNPVEDSSGDTGEQGSTGA